MFFTGGVLPGVDEVGDDLGNGDAMFDLGKDKGAVSAYPFGVPFHDGQIGAHPGGQVGLVDHEKIRLGDARATFAGYFVAPADIDDLDGEVGEFAAKTGGEIITAGLEEQDLGAEFGMQFLQGQ